MLFDTYLYCLFISSILSIFVCILLPPVPLSFYFSTLVVTLWNPRQSPCGLWAARRHLLAGMYGRASGQTGDWGLQWWDSRSADRTHPSLTPQLAVRLAGEDHAHQLSLTLMQTCVCACVCVHKHGCACAYGYAYTHTRTHTKAQINTHSIQVSTCT